MTGRFLPATPADGIRVSLPGGSPLLLELFRPDYLPSNELSESISRREELSYTDLLQLDRLESLYGRWLRAKSVNGRSAAMHRAVREIQPRIADVWVPTWSFRREDCGRRRFRDTLQVIAMLRRRGLDHLVFSEVGLIDSLARTVSESDAPKTQTTPRRCEGRSRAPAAAGGGSRRGGGDRGDDSGGDGGSDSGGDGPGEPSPRSRLWRYLARLAIIATIYGALSGSSLNPVAGPAGHQVDKTIIIRERVMWRDFDSRCGGWGGTGAPAQSENSPSAVNPRFPSRHSR